MGCKVVGSEAKVEEEREGNFAVRWVVTRGGVGGGRCNREESKGRARARQREPDVATCSLNFLSA
jgi:hypothetical protein